METIDSGDILFLCERWAKEERVDLCYKVDQLIIKLIEELISHDVRDLRDHNNVCRILSFRIGYSKSINQSVSSACKQLVDHIVNSECLLHSSKESNDQLLNILQLSLDCLVIAHIDESCMELIKKVVNLSVDIQVQHLHLLHGLSILECLLNALIDHGTEHSEYLLETYNLLQTEKFITFLASLLFVDDDKIILHPLLFNIVPKLIKATKCQTVISIFWNRINIPGKLDSISLSQKLFILCALADFYTISGYDDFSVIRSYEFWKIVQNGLLSNDNCLRKSGLYLLKRTLDVIGRFNVQLDLEIFTWNCLTSDHKFWERLFILLEILEEKQAHLVIPVVQETMKLGEDFKSVHASWFLVIYTRLLSHESLQVAKLGILHFLKLNIGLYVNCSYTYLIQLLFQRLNDMLVYSCHSNYNEWSDVDLGLREWFTNIIINTEIRVKLYSDVVEAMANINWCTIPLFHVLHNMSITPEAEIFDESKMKMFCEFVKEAVRTQNVFIRGAVQCAILNLLTKHTFKNISILSIALVPSALRRSECFCRGLLTWETAKHWVQSYSITDGTEILEQLLTANNNFPLQSKARTLVLFIDAGLIDVNSDFQKILDEYFSVLKDSYKRPYASVEESDRCLEFIMFILEESESVLSTSGLKNDKLIQSILPHINEIIPYIKKRFLDSNNSVNFDSVELYAKVLSALSENDLISITEVETLNERAFELYSSPHCSIGHRYLSLKVNQWYIMLFSTTKESRKLDDSIRLHILSLIRDDRIALRLSKDSAEGNLTRKQDDWCRFVSGSINSLWSIVQKCISADVIPLAEILNITSSEELIELATNSIETGGRDSLVPILSVMKTVLPSALSNADMVVRFLKFTWKSCFDLRKVAAFWPSIDVWIQMTLNSQLIMKKEIQKAILDFSEEILSQGETVNGLANLLMSHLKQELNHVRSVELMLPTLIDALVFGPVLRRDQRIENDTCALIRSLGTDYAVNVLIPQSDSRSSQQVRTSALAVLLASASQEGGSELLVNTVHCLLAKDAELTARRTRYHGDSLHHRVKHRILQVLLVLETVLADSASPLSKNCIVELVKWSSASLQGESQQPSVRYQLEWLLVRSLLHSPQLLANFWTIFGQASEERTGSICSFISVAYHLASVLQDEAFIERCVTEILPWCMAQHFNVRLYAQVVLQKLWPLDSKVAAKYEVIRKSLMKSLNQGNAVRNAEKLKTDFYFTAFHTLDHFSLETIFYELPRLSNISRDEWVSLSTLREICSGLNLPLPLTNQDNMLKQFTAATWVVKATEPEAGVEMEASGMQKKFVPWKGMRAELGMLSEDDMRSPSRTELVVVASLIDKVPNLGGLARSCEIFTAHSLVVASLEHTQDKLFASLSMSAEKHINIVEVKPHDIAQYLREKKKIGYTLVGAEQTASSVSLEAYKFPKKCLLLLGNEKEGIPVTLLPLLDVCVEVRQLGLVRSLNVHVTGALFIWEYTKQYMASGAEHSSQNRLS
uniref:tRNA (guanosine(18)-2'-O)-methyltransferase TARBP1 n=1 Tax=Graphocephala atropunctata TaxID=36148 RepID=A0A1B6LX73_9HEMI